MITRANPPNRANTYSHSRGHRAGITAAAGAAALVFLVAGNCAALAPPSETNPSKPDPLAVGTAFYDHLPHAGDHPCGKLAKEVDDVGPVKMDTAPSGTITVIRSGYSAAAIAGSLNPGNTCGDGDAAGLDWTLDKALSGNP